MRHRVVSPGSSALPEQSPSARGAAHGAGRDGWADVLATMESDTADAEHPTGRAAHAAWAPPADLGALPAMFRSRADRLVRAQQRAIASLEERMLVTGRHLAALDSIPSPRQSGGPAAYLDVTG
jgi:hypothetical protein